MDALLNGLGAALGFAALHAADGVLNEQAEVGCLCPPLGAVAVLLYALPSAPASQPKAVVGGHIVAGLVGYAIVSNEVAYYPEAIAVALTIALMTFFNVVHPPAGAYAFLFVNKKMGHKGMVAPGLVGAIVLVAIQQAVVQPLKKMAKSNAGSGGKVKKT